jgi:hypothetical protein
MVNLRKLTADWRIMSGRLCVVIFTLPWPRFESSKYKSLDSVLRPPGPAFVDMAVGALADCLTHFINCAFSIYARRLWSSILHGNRFGENDHIPLLSTCGSADVFHACLLSVDLCLQALKKAFE